MEFVVRHVFLRGSVRTVVVVEKRKIRNGRDFDEVMDYAEQRLGRPVGLIERGEELWIYRE